MNRRLNGLELIGAFRFLAIMCLLCPVIFAGKVKLGMTTCQSIALDRPAIHSGTNTDIDRYLFIEAISQSP